MAFTSLRRPFQTRQTVRKNKSIAPYKDVMITENARAKRMTLRLDHKRRCFVVSMPTGYPPSRAHRFIDEQAHWIAQKLKTLPPIVDYKHGAIISLFGEETQIHITPKDNTKRTVFELKGRLLSVTTNLDDPAPRIKRYLKTRAKEVFTELAYEKAEQIGATLNAVTIRDTASRWGSCSADGRISLSWRLIFAPFYAMDYVIAHEVAHLIHLNHGTDFWTLCHDLAIDGKKGHAWMRKNGQSLMRFK